MNKRQMIWTPEIKEKLVKYVDARVSEGKSQKEAIAEFCESAGEQFKRGTASVFYYRHKKAEKLEESEAVIESNRRHYALDEERKLLLGSWFAHEMGLKKRDVSRFMAEQTGRKLRAVDQKMNTLQSLYKRGELKEEVHLRVPEECPEDIVNFLVEVYNFKVKSRQERDNAPNEIKKEVAVTTLSAAEAEEMDVFEILGRMSKAARTIEGLNFDLFLRQLAILSSMAADHSEVGNLRNENFNLTRELNRANGEVRSRQQEIESLRSQVAFLKEKIAEYDDFINKVKEQQETLDFTVKQLAEMRTIDQVTALRDLVNHWRKEIDEYGTVIKVVDEWRIKFDEQLREKYSQQAS